MARGRLKRESNPIPNEVPGFTPQHDSTGQGDFVNTSPVNPLPVDNAEVVARLNAIETELHSIKQNQTEHNQQVIQTIKDMFHHFY